MSPKPIRFAMACSVGVVFSASSVGAQNGLVLRDDPSRSMLATRSRTISFGNGLIRGAYDDAGLGAFTVDELQTQFGVTPIPSTNLFARFIPCSPLGGGVIDPASGAATMSLSLRLQLMGSAERDVGPSCQTSCVTLNLNTVTPCTGDPLVCTVVDPDVTIAPGLGFDHCNGQEELLNLFLGFPSSHDVAAGFTFEVGKVKSCRGTQHVGPGTGLLQCDLADCQSSWTEGRIREFACEGDVCPIVADQHGAAACWVPNPPFYSGCTLWFTEVSQCG